MRITIIGALNAGEIGGSDGGGDSRGGAGSYYVRLDGGEIAAGG